jgi:ubiquitin-like modifier-activating enzyme ATG7
MTNASFHEEGWIVKFVPFTSSVESPFWVKYCQEKLDRIKLSEEPIDLNSTYGIESPPRIQCQESSLFSTSAVHNERVSVAGKLVGFNTLEAFQKVDKNKLLNDSFLKEFLDGKAGCLASVLLCTFADLKSHKVLYWFGFPSLMMKQGVHIRATEQTRLGNLSSSESSYPKLASHIEFMRRSLMADGVQGLSPYFIFSPTSCLPLSTESYEGLKNETNDGAPNIVFGFFDPTGPVVNMLPELAMGWPMRNLIAFLCFHLNLGGMNVKILSYRTKCLRRISSDDSHHATAEEDDSGSILITVRVPLKEHYYWGTGEEESSCFKVVGWELNARSKPGPRWVNLRPLLDSKHLAVQAADLNLKLMKWRMIPDLKVDELQSKKILLIGAGTLGCSVARTLLGWGIRSFKIIDNGRVCYSNPVRQSLFTLDDCRAENGNGLFKCVAAAEALKTIAADVEAKGIVLSIPMPGHTETREALETSVQTLDKLVQETDVVFLLTDTRESRWLPTVMAAAHNKMLINAALGLDSWLVMRHGGGFASTTPLRFGCYFCNDVVAPENSTKNRTLDQQCTVTRPGLAPIASSMAVELMVSMLHHPDGIDAPGPASGSSNFSPTVAKGDSAVSPLGVIPHQIRGSLVSYTMMTPTVPAFKNCTGCSSAVVNAYLNDKIGTVIEACLSVNGAYLENLSGLTAFRAEAAEAIESMDHVDWEDE